MTMTMKYFTTVAAVIVASLCGLTTEAFSPQTNKANNAVQKGAELKNAVASTFAAVAIGSSILANPLVADASIDVSPQQQVFSSFSSSNVIAEKVVRQGLYSEYEVEINQEVDDARSTFKSAKETKSKKGKYTAILAILVVGSFIVPMAQYFWYVKDDDSSDRFFAAQDIPEPEPPKKKGWFN